MIGIYKIQSVLKPKRIYIGGAININERWKDHLKKLKRNIHHSKKLQNHFNKYGISDLYFSILLECEKENMIKVEQYFLDSYNPYFNICKIAGNTSGFKHSEETKMKISEKQKGKIISKESRIKMSEARKGIKLSDEHKKKLSIIRSGKKIKPLSDEHKRKLSNSKKGMKHSEETRKKMSDFHKGKPSNALGKHWTLSENTKQKMRNVWALKKSKFITEDVRA
jgi:group I intron endonuclease